MPDTGIRPTETRSVTAGDPTGEVEQRLGAIRRDAHRAVVAAVRQQLAEVGDLRAALPGLLAEVMLALDCQSVVVVVLDEAAGEFRVFAQVGMDAGVLTQWSAFPADAPVPARDALVTGSIVMITSTADRDRRYPAFAGVAAPRGTYATVPMLVDGRGVGAMTFAWQRVWAADADSEALLLEVAAACGETLATPPGGRP